jgi:hypothetical protein
MIHHKKQAALGRAAGHGYRNPVILAQEWEKALAEGRYASSADLSRCIGASRALITQILRLLRLLRPCHEVLDTVITCGDPLSSPLVTERSLRPVVGIPIEEQKEWIQAIISGE